MMQKHLHNPRHNMLVIGESAIFLSHLPRFKPPHNLQLILEVTLQIAKTDLGVSYAKERRSHPTTKVYTLAPELLNLEAFLTPSLDQEDRRVFRATLFRGHLERGGRPVASFTDIDVQLRNVVYSQRCGIGVEKPDYLEYVLFGSGQECYLAHMITAPPDFDQIISVKLDSPPPQAELSRGICVALAHRKNLSSQRITEGERISGQGNPVGAQPFLSWNMLAGTEIYFEESGLASSK